MSELTKAAFRDHPFIKHIEHLIIRALRSAAALTISLVTKIDGQVVGYIAFSPVTISDGMTDWYGLGPVSVLPELQGCRIGTAMVNNNGLGLLTSMHSKGCVLIGIPTYYNRFGFKNYPKLIHEGVPQEVFVAKSFVGPVPRGMVEFHQAFKQLSIIEKDAIADGIIDYEIDGVMVEKTNKTIESIIKKEILTEMSHGKFMLHPSALAAYDTYFSKIGQFRATEMSRVHKNPILTAVAH